MTREERRQLLARLRDVAGLCLEARRQGDWQLSALYRAEAREISTQLAHIHFRQTRAAMLSAQGH